MRSSLLSAALLALVGCAATEQNTDEAQDPSPIGGDMGVPDDPYAPPPPVKPGLVLRIASGDGEVVPVMPLSTKDEAYIRILGEATAADVVDSDYAFRVLDLNGKLVSSDDPACRSFHVNRAGRIDLVHEGRDASGAICTHEARIADNNSLVIQLVPFADVAVDANGVMSYTVEAFPVGIETSSYSLSTPLSVVAPAAPEPFCGDGTVDEGEECDDGNEDNDDSCTTSCTVAPEPFCGDGTVDEGEECDDGNEDNDDGCTTSCTVAPCHS